MRQICLLDQALAELSQEEQLAGGYTLVTDGQTTNNLSPFARKLFSAPKSLTLLSMA